MRKHLPVLGAAVVAMAAVLGAGTVATLAADNETVVKERQAAMRQRSADLKTINAYIDDKGGDQASAVAAAKEMLVLEQKIDASWLPGTSSTDLPGKSNAKPEIWAEMDKFKAMGAILQSGQQKLLAALEQGDKTGAKAIIADFGRNSCGACHTAYRVKAS
ncbi:MAG TPA: cytochrome c [Stellaceae bacterium]|nr:cytochrome c [Stellaceae bacterium]